MRNPIARAMLTVVAFWWLLLALHHVLTHLWPLESWANMGRAFARVVPALQVAVLAGLASAALTATLWFAYRMLVRRVLASRDRRGVVASIGPVPDGLGMPAIRRGSRLVLPESDPVSRAFKSLTKHHPAHAAVLRDLIDMHAAGIDIPAAPVLGGHGGLTLWEHDINVMRAMIERASSWTYTPKADRAGVPIHPLKDPEYTFDAQDPLIPLIGFAHDIGKLECYEWVERAGRRVVRERKRGHDSVGARMLARLDSVWALERADREALVLVVAHYHHPQDLPLYADDRTRALMEFLIECDNAASRAEGRAFDAVDKGRAEAAPAAEGGGAADEAIWSAFVEILAAPGRINGANADARVGYKKGSLVVLSEQRIRHVLAAHLQQPRLADDRLGDGRYMLSARLMRVLDDKGVLYRRHEGREYSHKRALFRVRFRGKNKVFPEIPAAILIEPGQVLPALARIEDTSAELDYIRPVWGERSARHKRGDGDEAPAAEEAVGLPPEVSPQSGPVADEDTPSAVLEEGALREALVAWGLEGAAPASPQSDAQAARAGDPVTQAQASDASPERADERTSESPPQAPVPSEGSGFDPQAALTTLVTAAKLGTVTNKRLDDGWLTIALDARAREALGAVEYDHLLGLEGTWQSESIRWARGAKTPDLVILHVKVA